MFRCRAIAELLVSLLTEKIILKQLEPMFALCNLTKACTIQYCFSMTIYISYLWKRVKNNVGNLLVYIKMLYTFASRALAA